MEIGEGVDAHSPAPPRKKRPIKVRITFFFDGTGNSRSNIRYREQHPRMYWWWSLINPWQTDSYRSDFSNVVRLAENLEPRALGYEEYIRVYTEGIGTTDEDVDSFEGSGIGTGITGIRLKVLKGIGEALHTLTQLHDPSDVVIELLSVDTCGFSRGAAAARHCVHRVLNDETYGLRTQLERMRYEVGHVEVLAVGLFDTVSSWGLSVATAFNAAYDDNVARLQLDAIRQAAQVYQLAAAEEYRERFSLTDITSAGGKGRQVYLPGAHSDVGGGYGDGVGEDQELVVGSASSAVAHFMLARGWYKGGPGGPELTYVPAVSSTVVAYGGYSAYVPEHVTAQRAAIARAYTFIPLRLMARFFEKQRVPVSSDLYGLFVPKGVPGRAWIEQYAENISASKPSDWDDDTQPEIKALRHGYLHVSFRNDKIGMGVRLTPQGRPCRHVYHG